MPSAPAAAMPTMPMPGPPDLEATDEALNAQYRQIVELYEAGTYDAAIPLANELGTQSKDDLARIRHHTRLRSAYLPGSTKQRASSPKPSPM